MRPQLIDVPAACGSVEAMDTYCATFVPGIEELVRAELTAMHAPVEVIESGFVVFTSGAGWKKFQNIRLFNNSFLILDQSRGEGVEGVNRALARSPNLTSHTVREIVRGKKTFKIVSSVENQTVAPDRAILRTAEERIARGTRLALNIKAPSIEFWIIVRREGQVYIALRISSARKENAERADGALRAEVAHIMVRVSDVRPHDVVLDPFAGSGALILERAFYAPYRSLTAYDHDRDLVATLKKKMAKLKNAKVEIADALHLPDANSTVTRIITDPPWGMHEAKDDLPAFYSDMLKGFSRVLMSKGIAVVLTAAKEAMDNAVGHSNFALEERYDILVSGKKAAIYKLRRKT